jgi:hypothetical protein
MFMVPLWPRGEKPELPLALPWWPGGPPLQNCHEPCWHQDRIGIFARLGLVPCTAGTTIAPLEVRPTKMPRHCVARSRDIVGSNGSHLLLAQEE